ncbi:MAG TPA: serine hydrolase [Candidatus Acidoferrum sp.]|jgi:CubicO group peptidase (beta-lactamase class C family)
MKSASTKALLLTTAFALVATLLSISPFLSPKFAASNVLAPDSQSPTTPSPDPAQAARISRIESGLLPAVIIKGQPPQFMTVADRMAHYKVPGVSVAFFDHGQILWTRAYGLADVAAKKPVSSDTLFQAASISKPVAALAALHLVQEGKLTLDEDVNIKLKTWKVPDNAFTAKERVTVRRILSHSAGLTVHGFPGYASDEPIPTAVQILNGEKPANTDHIRVDIVPGTLWRYSGGGYVVLQTLLSDVTGKPFPQIMSELVLRPAGMTHSTYEQPLPKNRVPESATPYRANGDPVKGGAHTYPEMAPAGLWTTPSDLARVAMEVQSEYAGKSTKILSQDMARQMLTKQIGTWGLGFSLDSTDGKISFSHGGANEGFRCNLHAYTDSGQGLAVMTNSDSGGELTEEIFRSVAKEYSWPDYKPVEHTLIKINPATFATYPGTYEIPGIGKLTISMTPTGLQVQAEPFGPDPQGLLPESPTNFFVLSGDITFTFQKDPQGVITGLTLRAGPQTFEAKKIS